MTFTGELEQTMARSFNLGSRLRRYAHANQFGAESDELKEAISSLMEQSESVIGSNIKGTLVSDVFHLLDNSHEDSDYLAGEDQVAESEGDPAS